MKKTSEFLTNFKEFWGILLSPKAKQDLIYYFILIIAILAASAYFQVLLNLWSGHIFDAISTKDIYIFFSEIKSFFYIAGALLFLGVAQTYVYEFAKIRLRKSVTYNLITSWINPECMLSSRGTEFSKNPDQRIQEDVRNLADISVDLVVGLIQSSFILFAFIGVLWELSEHIVFCPGDNHFTIPGYIVWVVLAYSTLGSLLTYFVGKPLINAYNSLSNTEASFRFALMQVNDCAEEIHQKNTEDKEKKVITNKFENLLTSLREIAKNLIMLAWVTGGYGWLSMLVPLCLGAPGVFGGTLSVGQLIMIVGGFNQINQALRFFIDRYPQLARWGVCLERTMGYNRSLKNTEGKNEK